mmetsp:Transcript_107634/g.309799  ORF Transcript_107634/g.309799 Transcript_107634/m.309799 type:complete len:213 (-) Transcript_107634:393-1031(-)
MASARSCGARTAPAWPRSPASSGGTCMPASCAHPASRARAQLGRRLQAMSLSSARMKCWRRRGGKMCTRTSPWTGWAASPCRPCPKFAGSPTSRCVTPCTSCRPRAAVALLRPSPARCRGRLGASASTTQSSPAPRSSSGTLSVGRSCSSYCAGRKRAAALWGQIVPGSTLCRWLCLRWARQPDSLCIAATLCPTRSSCCPAARASTTSSTH